MNDKQMCDEEFNKYFEEEPRDIEVCGSFFTKSEYDKLAQGKEEKKIPEKLEYWQGLDKVRNDCELDDLEYAIKYGNYNFEMFFNKINQIIDYLKSKGE